MLENLNKKSVIAIAIVVILGILAIAGTVVFLKDKGTTDAVDVASENGSNSETVNENVQKDESNTTADKNVSLANNENNTNNQTNNNQSNTQTTSNSNTSRNNTTNNNSQNNTGASDSTNQTNSSNNETSEIDSIQSSTITRVTEGDLVKVTDDRNVAWKPMELKMQPVSAKIDSEKSDISIKKIANTKTGSNLVTQGEEIKYTLKIKNNSDEDVKNVEVADIIPEKTTYVDGSAGDFANIIIENDVAVGIKWYIDIKAGESVETKFTVKVNEDATGTILNKALTNGNTSSNEVKTAVIKSSKTAKIGEKNEKETVKIGDKIVYTIAIENTGDISGIINVKDEELAKLIENQTLIADESSSEIVSKLIDGISVEVNANEITKIVFTMIVNNINGEIKNIATVGIEEPEVVIDTVNIDGVKANNDADKVVKPGDTFDYTITLTNSGSKKGTARVTDNVPETLEIVSTNPEATITGNNVDFGDVEVEPGTPKILTIKVRVKNGVTGTIKNIGKVDGKDVPDPSPIDTVNISGVKENNDTDKVVKPEDTFDYTITLTNSGSKKGTARVTDNVPETLEIVSTNPEATITGNNVDFGDVEVEPGTPKILTIKVRVKNGVTGTIKNIGKVDGKDVPDPSPIDTVNISVTKSQDLPENTVVKYGDNIKYTITAKNEGTASGKVTIKDTIPENTELVGDIKLIINGNETTITEENLKNGYLLTLGGNQEAKIEFNVRVIGYAGKGVVNTAKYQRENEEEKSTGTVSKSIEDTTNVVTTVTTEKSTPQKVILVLDLSGSMDDEIWTGKYNKFGWKEYKSKLSLMKDAVEMFLSDFFTANPKNEVMLITYAKKAKLAQDFTSNKNSIINAIGSANGGTNIDAGLTLANEKITDIKHTSVILMTDGIPGYYVDEKGEIKMPGSGWVYNDEAGEETIKAGKSIKDRGVNLYAIGFGLEDTKAREMLKKTASENKCYETFNGDALKEAFKNISESITSDNDPIPMDTQNGKIVMNNGFKVGQDVEIYVGEYKKDSSVPYKKYTWEQFINLKDGTTEISKYDETSNTLTFDLGKYMESEKIAANQEVVIRFVSTTANTQNANNISTMSLINNEAAVEEENIDEKESNQLNEVEQSEQVIEENSSDDTILNDEKYKDALENNVQEWDEINKTEEDDTKQNVTDDSKNEVENTNNEDLKEDEQNKDENNENNVSENEILNTEINNSLEEKTTTDVIDDMEEKTETESKENLNETSSEFEESNNTSINEKSETESLDSTLEVKE